MLALVNFTLETQFYASLQGCCWHGWGELGESIIQGGDGQGWHTLQGVGAVQVLEERTHLAGGGGRSGAGGLGLEAGGRGLERALPCSRMLQEGL